MEPNRSPTVVVHSWFNEGFQLFEILIVMKNKNSHGVEAEPGELITLAKVRLFNIYSGKVTSHKLITSKLFC